MMHHLTPQLLHLPEVIVMAQRLRSSGGSGGRSCLPSWLAEDWQARRHCRYAATTVVLVIVHLLVIDRVDYDQDYDQEYEHDGPLMVVLACRCPPDRQARRPARYAITLLAFQPSGPRGG